MKIRDLLKNSDSDFKRYLIFFLTAYFLVLLNYSLVRSASSALFFDNIGAKSSPLAWLFAVVLLSGSIFVCNKLQTIFSVQKVFFLASGFSAFLMATASYLVKSGNPLFSYLPFIWKEIYIVIQIHLLLAYANSHYHGEIFKMLVGPIGAVGSIGGVVGGLLTRYLSSLDGTYLVMWIGLLLVIVPALFFLKTPIVLKESAPTQKSPLASLTPEIKKYIAYIAGIVALTQFIINIADYNFNVAFAEIVKDSNERTTYLGDASTVINLLTFIFQFVFLPIILPRVSEKNYHLFIPVAYLLGALALIGTNSIGLLSVASFYIFLKASDYSLFSSGKELLYQPLESRQKYGAKYLTDMLTYRLAKALIATVLIYLQSSTILNVLMIIFLILWIILVIKMFSLHRRIFNY